MGLKPLKNPRADAAVALFSLAWRSGQSRIEHQGVYNKVSKGYSNFEVVGDGGYYCSFAIAALGMTAESSIGKEGKGFGSERSFNRLISQRYLSRLRLICFDRVCDDDHTCRRYGGT